MHNEIIQSLGVSKRAASLYLATLPLGIASIQKIASASGIKRSSVYEHIDELLSCGLLEKVPIGKRTYYQACDPTRIEQKLRDQLTDFQESLKEMSRLRDQTAGKPSITVFEGRGGLRQIYKEIERASAVRFWSALSDIEKIFPKEIQSMAEAIRHNQVRTVELVPNRPDVKRSVKRFALSAGRTYEARILNGDILNDNAVYGNVVALFRVHEWNLFVVRIEDATITGTMRALFDAAWKSAKPLP